MTRSLSNIIKAYSIRYENDGIHTIDANSRYEVIKLRNNLKVIENSKTSPEKTDGEGEFKKIAEMKIAQAKQEAQVIIDEAKKEAERLKIETIEEAKKLGYEEGLEQGKIELSNQIAQYEEEKKKLHQEYESMVKNLEPFMVEVITTLIQKITGIMIENKKDIIFYLVDKAMKRMDLSTEYKIKVSKEDFEYMESRKDDLIRDLKKDVNLEIEEDSKLTKNQCLIETENQVIDCSLDTQLNNLITDIKLLSN